MRRSGLSSLVASTVFVVVFAAAPVPVAAQLCGDADGNGVIDLADGVQVLRAAALLPSPCTLAACDIDVDGTITLIDGVIVLRKAASLPINENCVASQGAPNSQVRELFEFVQPLLTKALPVVVQNRNATSDDTISCDNSSDDGEILVEALDSEVSINFSGCRLDDTIFNGDVLNAEGNPEIELELADRNEEESITLFGEGVRASDLVSGVAFDGNLEASPSFDSDTTDFLLTLETIEIDAGGAILSGRLTFFLEEAEVTGVDQVDAFYDGSNLVRVVVTMSDNSTQVFLYDLIFGNFV